MPDYVQVSPKFWWNQHADVLMLPQAAAAGETIVSDIFFFMIFMIAVHKALLKAPPSACVLKFWCCYLVKDQLTKLIWTIDICPTACYGDFLVMLDDSLHTKDLFSVFFSP